MGNLNIIQYDDRSQKHPKECNLPDWLPKHEFLMVIVAPAGSGKTTLLLNILLNIYKQYWHKIKVFSPTVHTDTKWEHVKECEDILMPLTTIERDTPPPADRKHDGEMMSKKELVEQMEEMMYEGSSTNTRRGKVPARHPYKASYYKTKKEESEKGFDEKQKAKLNNFEYLLKNILQFPNKKEKDKILLNAVLKNHYEKQILHHEDDEEERAPRPSNKKTAMQESDFNDEYDDAMLDNIMERQDRIAKHVKRRKLPMADHMPRLLWVFDDMVGSGLFNQRRNNAFKRLTVRRRHFYSSLICVTQAYKEIPKTTRTNANALILFRIDSEEELQVIYKEYPMGLKLHEWLAVYHYCTDQPYQFMMLNLQTSNIDHKIVKNFNQPISRAFISQLTRSRTDPASEASCMTVSASKFP